MAISGHAPWGRLTEGRRRLEIIGNAKGRIKLSGRLTLDYVPVRRVAEIDLGTLAGTGHLAILAG